LKEREFSKVKRPRCELGGIMAYNKDKVDEMTLALLHLVMETGKDGARLAEELFRKHFGA
jgi:hypothetical protein